MPAKATNPQEQAWRTKFGKKYTDRNDLTLAQHQKSYVKKYGISRTDMNYVSLPLKFDSKILEVGCGTGLQLEALRKMGFNNLSGLEVQRHAARKAQDKGFEVAVGSLFDMPFEDGAFAVVFTSCVLIHVAPEDIKKALKEICRCSGWLVWGFEYWSADCTMVPYRGKDDMLWRADYSKLYIEQGLKLLNERWYRYRGTNNLSTMFLLKKQ